MFTSQQRERLRRQLLGLAGKDPRITAAAVTGSAADGLQDRWSDIDLFLGVADDVELETILADWSDYLYGELAALHHFDLEVPAAVYRAFLLPSCLEVDLGFTPASQFGPRGPHFRAVFGEVTQAPQAAPPAAGHLIGLAWHHVLHARSCIERGKPWQAEYWISGIRDQTLALACRRLGATTAYAKGADALPVEVTGGLAGQRSLSAIRSPAGNREHATFDHATMPVFCGRQWEVEPHGLRLAARSTSSRSCRVAPSGSASSASRRTTSWS